MDLSPMGPFLQMLKEGYRLCFAGGSLLLAVSGGADSVALLRGTLFLAEELGCSIQVAHLDHGLRGRESAEDAAWVEALCQNLGVPVILGEADVLSHAQKNSQTLEEAAREVRYRFLEQHAQLRGCSAIVLGHTADDQAETVLHHLLRGSGLTGLGGIPRVRELACGIRLIRPLLRISRAQVEEYLGELPQDYRHDASNDSLGFTRNRIRHELLPILEKDYNPRVRSALLRLAQQAAEAQEIVSETAATLMKAVLLEQTPNFLVLDRAKLKIHSRSLIRAVLVELWKQQGWPRQRMSFEHWERIADVVLHSGAIDVPGKVHVRTSQGRLILQQS